MVRSKIDRKVILKHVYWRCVLSTGKTIYEVMYPKKYVEIKGIKYATFETLEEALKERNRMFKEIDDDDTKYGVHSEDFHKIKAYTDKIKEFRNLCLLCDAAKLNYYRAIREEKDDVEFLRECYQKAKNDRINCKRELEVMKQHLGSYAKKDSIKGVARGVYVYVNRDLEITHYNVIPKSHYKKLINSSKNYKFKSLEEALDFRNLTDKVVDVHMMEQFEMWYKNEYPDKSLPYSEHILKEMKKF